MKIFSLLRDEPDRTWSITVNAVTDYDPSLVPLIVEMDLLTHSRPNFTRHTARTLIQHGRVYLLQADELVIGAAQCMRSWKNPDEVILFNMAIRPGWRGHGLGTFFMQELLRNLEGQGIDSIILNVHDDNAVAMRLYRGYGFETVDHFQRDPDSDGGFYTLRKRLFANLPTEELPLPGYDTVLSVSEKDAYDAIAHGDASIEATASKG